MKKPSPEQKPSIAQTVILVIVASILFWGFIYLVEVYVDKTTPEFKPLIEKNS